MGVGFEVGRERGMSGRLADGKGKGKRAHENTCKKLQKK